MRIIFLSILLATAFPTGVFADILDFENLDLDPGDLIPQSYGDTAAVDVTYRGEFFNTDQITYDNLAFMDAGYGDLENFVFTPHFDGGTVYGGAVVLFGLGGNHVTLEAFDAAGLDEDSSGWVGWGSFRVYDGNYTLLFEELQVDFEEGSHITFLPDVTADELILKWTAIDSSRFVGIDNIQFSVQPVPEPGCFVALAVLFFACPIRLRRGSAESRG